MNLSNVKLVAVDMDGTLLNSKGEIADGFYPLFDELSQSGVRFAAASGRQYYNLLNRFRDIKDRIIFIAENGSYAVYKNEVLLVQAMDHAVVKSLLETAEKIEQTAVVLCGKKSAYIQNSEPDFLAHVQMYYDRYKLVKDLKQLDDDEFLKIAIFDFAGSEQNSYPYFKPLQNQLQVKISGSNWLDLSHIAANKGRALAAVQERFHVTVEETMVFGDYLNDLEMMTQGYFSFAMSNAHPHIKKAARYTAKSNDENGVTVILEELVKQLQERASAAL